MDERSPVDSFQKKVFTLPPQEPPAQVNLILLQRQTQLHHIVHNENPVQLYKLRNGVIYTDFKYVKC